MNKIIIEKDGWVYLRNEDLEIETGLGDIGVNVEIVDLRETTCRKSDSNTK